MTPRNRFITALHGQQPDVVPLWEIEFHLFDRYSGHALVLGHAFAALSASEQERALWRNAELMASVARHLGFSALTSPGGYWEIAPGEPAYYWLPGDASWEQLRILRAVVGEEIALAKGVGGLLMPPIGAGYEEFCYWLFDAPDEVTERAEAMLAGGIEALSRARDLGADAAVCACDIADNHGVFFPPAQLDAFWLPYYRRWATAARDADLCGILHSDGNLTAIIDQLADSDIHGLQAIDPIAGMEIGAVKAAVGDRLCLCGNLDCGLLQFGPAEAITVEISRVLAVAKPGGGFVLGGSNAIFPQIPTAHYEAMLATWRAEGAY
jgi:uroporphyrinogen decarboxylase